MCTVIILRRPDHRWPVLIAANRDEMIHRPWQPPGRHWSDRPEIVAGQDLLAGGSWLGLNDWGVAAAVLNRSGSLGPAPGRRSRGELVLEALDHADAVAAADALSHLDPDAYRSFNLIIIDNRDAFWLRHDGGRRIAVHPLKEGLSLIASGDIDDARTPRVKRVLPRFRTAPAPDPDRGDWQSWQNLLSDPDVPPGMPADAAMRFETARGYGTVASALIALPDGGDPDVRPIFRFAAWQPVESGWQDLSGA